MFVGVECGLFIFYLFGHGKKNMNMLVRVSALMKVTAKD